MMKGNKLYRKILIEIEVETTEDVGSKQSCRGIKSEPQAEFLEIERLNKNILGLDNQDQSMNCNLWTPYAYYLVYAW